MNYNNMIKSLNKENEYGNLPLLRGLKMIHYRFKLFSLIVLFTLLLTSCSNLDIQTLNLKAKQLIDSGDIDGAIGRLESINDLNPAFPQTHYNLGIAYYKKGEFDKAVKSLNEAVRLDPKLGDAYYSLGVIYEDLALTDIEKASKDNKIENLEVVNKILENLKYSQESYKKYLNLTQNPSETEDIKIKLENINNDINKYQSILIEKYDPNQE
ncbi:MAG: hypothetical protein A2287_09080 [Candidatus Melainabacteria bacterium RIFOXYA12_FULL_32_12]|nr:MAG: hypothetical protein A2287_09080 [Candidatus Melainabacteria bacterium RIFOXYA12_FULL_32_12]